MHPTRVVRVCAGVVVMVGMCMAACVTASSSALHEPGPNPSTEVDARSLLVHAEQLRADQPAASADVLEDMLRHPRVRAQLSDRGHAMLYAMLADVYGKAGARAQQRDAMGHFLVAASLLDDDELRVQSRQARAYLLAEDIEQRARGASAAQAIIVEDAQQVADILAMLRCPNEPQASTTPATPNAARRYESHLVRCGGTPQPLWFALDN
jgi:hypothetical protein